MKMNILFAVLLLIGCHLENSENGDTRVYALNLNFDNWTGGMVLQKGTANPGNYTMSVIEGRNCLQVNANTLNQYGSTGVEFEFDLVNTDGTPAFIDMSGEDWTVEFKYYLPSGGIVPTAVQYALYESRNWHVIYSVYADCSTTDSWMDVTIPVNQANVGYSSFDNDPDDWSVNKFRLQFVSANEDETILVYIDDLQVYSGSAGEDEPEPYNPYIEYTGLNGIARNPIISHIFTADPSAHVFNGRVYVYASHDLDDQTGYNMKDYHVFSSDDLVNWQDHGVALHVNDISWANALYAPDCVQSPADGKYYLYFPDSGSGIGVAVSDSPEGPFVDAIGAPLIDNTTPGVVDVEWVFDPMCFIDDDNEVYLYFGGGMPGTGDNARVIRLNSDMTSLKDASATTIVAPDYFEAPFMHKRNGKYYFSYSTTFENHSAEIDYMMSDNPISGFVYQGTILENPPHNNNDNNHHSIAEFNGLWYIFYHNRIISNRDGFTNYQRSVTMDYLTYNVDDTIIQVTPTDGTVTQVKNLDAFATIEAEMMADQRRIEVEFAYESATLVGVNVTDIHDKEWIGYSQVDFGAGATLFHARVASDFADGGEIEICIDGCDLFTNIPGTLIGTCVVNTTGGWQAWTDVSCAIAETVGVHDVYLRFKGTESEELFNLNYFYFE
jgi:arabinoxylan arabinofuranohydrolase